MIFESCRSIADEDHCCFSKIRCKETSRFWLVVWSIFLGICNIVICGYIGEKFSIMFLKYSRCLIDRLSVEELEIEIQFICYKTCEVNIKKIKRK